MLPRFIERCVKRGEVHRRRLAGIGLDHVSEFVGFPLAQHHLGERIDDAGGADHQRPGDGDGAEQIMPVEPGNTARLVPQGAKAQAARERPVQHHAGDDRDQEQESHRTEEQLAGLARKHIDVQLQEDQHRAAADRAERLGGVGVVRPERRRIRIAIDLVVGEGDHRVRFVLVPQDILQDATGIVRQRRAGDLVDAPLHRARLGDLGLRIVAEQFVDLMMEDQRQAGDAQQQQEQRRYQAAPGVNHRPDANGSGFQRCLLPLRRRYHL